MSSKINAVFKRLRKKGEAALIPFITAGDPNADATIALVLEMAKNGADIIELGLPFSDPLADGPTIQAASFRALQAGMTPELYFEIVKEIRKNSSVPLVLMGYYNPVLKYNLENFAKDAKKAGIDGTIIPDLPLEEAGPWMGIAKEYDLANILLVAPNTPENRIRRIVRASTGFIYYVSVLGITGARSELPKELALGLKRVQSHTKKPVAVGFGISRPEQVQGLSKIADGIIVGSAIVKMFEQCQKEGMDRAIKSVGKFVRELKEATKS